MRNFLPAFSCLLIGLWRRTAGVRQIFLAFLKPTCNNIHVGLSTNSMRSDKYNSHEMVPETALHHDPIYGTGEVDVGGEEHDVLPLQGGDALVHLHEVGHHL